MNGQLGHPTKQKRVGKVKFSTPAKKARFLEVFARHGTIQSACLEVDVARSLVKYWMNNDQAFRQGMIDAKLTTVDMLKETAIDRARRGSDPLLIFLLKSLAPDEFSERIRHEFTAKTLDAVVSEVLEAIRANVPDFCPHCKTAMDIAPAIARELMDMSARLSNARKDQVAP